MASTRTHCRPVLILGKLYRAIMILLERAGTFSQVMAGLRADGWVQGSLTVEPGVAETSGAIGAICTFIFAL